MTTGLRQHLLVALLLGALCACLAGCAATGSKSGSGSPTVPAVQDAGQVAPAEAIRRLTEGNARFVSGQTQHPRRDAERRAELASTQRPFAVIVGCADSRTGPEVIFDQGLGDLFVVRVAGNVLDDHATGSVEYAVEHVHASLVVVMGHQRCGAISAARDTIAANGHAEGHVQSLVVAIRPAVEATAGQDVEATCKANVRNVVRGLRTSEPILRHMVEAKQVRVVGAYYDLDTGAVVFMEGE